MLGDLTTVDRVKTYLGDVTGSGSDAILQQMVSAVSKVVLNYVNRSTFAVQQFADVYDGNGKGWLLLRQWPVLSVAKVEFDRMTLDTPSDTSNYPPTTGFTVEDADTVGGAQQRLLLWGYAFPSGRSNVRVTYTAGYRTLGEAASVPDGGSYVLDPLNTWIADIGVSYANGTAMTAVAASPAAGQYAVVNGQYAFAAADAGADVLLSYSSVPADVDMATVQLAAEYYRRRTRVGMVSQTVGGQQTVSYSQKDMHDSVKLALQPFRRVTPT